ncbi:hypothetical protein NSDW_12310 [Novosphingobium olei]|nr:hypothetical protein NSDW_12310 [Novosphingobium olei]
MKSRLALIAACLLASAGSAVPAHAVPGGKLHTLAIGHWLCEQPGDATKPPVRLEADDFWAVQDSSYSLRNGETGTYLLLADRLVMTSGPFEGRAYAVESAATVHPLGSDGKETGMRCVKSGTPSAYVDMAETNPPLPTKN